MIPITCIILACIPSCYMFYWLDPSNYTFSRAELSRALRDDFLSSIDHIPDKHEWNKPLDPIWTYHMTRWNWDAPGRGCSLTHDSYPYSHIINLPREFDLYICNLYETCLITNHPNFNELFRSDKTIKIHVFSNFKQHKFFFERVLPAFENRKKETGAGVMLYSGGGDVSVSQSTADIILGFSCVKHWAIEQNHLYPLHIQRRVIEVPVGICLRDVANEAEHRPHIHRNLTIYSQHRRVTDAIEYASKKNWADRSDRILVCFVGNNNPNREMFVDWARDNCTVCDTCNMTSAGHGQSHLWEIYSQYKFIVSPLGNGFDCGRTWEIMLMGAIPVIHRFAGVRGYSEGGLSVVNVTGPEELTPANQQLWLSTFNQSNDPYKLSFEYWHNRIFTF